MSESTSGAALSEIVPASEGQWHLWLELNRISFLAAALEGCIHINTVTNPLVVLDADSTTLQDEVIELIADAAGSRKEVAEITDRAMRGEIDFVQSLRARVRTLEGLPVQALHDVVEKVRPTPGIRELADAVHSRNGVVGVVSGGFHEILDRVLPDLGIDIWAANRLEVIDEKLTGELYGPIIDAQAKADTLRQWSIMSGIPLDRSIAIGDGANDLLMMEIAGLSIAFNAKPIVKERADVSVSDNLAGVIPHLSR